MGPNYLLRYNCSSEKADTPVVHVPMYHTSVCTIHNVSENLSCMTLRRKQARQ